MMLNFATTLHVIFKDVKKVTQVVTNEDADSEESADDDSSENEEKAGQDDFPSILSMCESPVFPLISNNSFIRPFGEDILEDCHISSPTPPPEL